MKGDVRGERRTFADLRPRILSSLVLAGVAIAALWAGGVLFAMFWLAAGLAILWEWQALIGERRHRARFLAGAVGIAVAAAFASYIALAIASVALAAAAVLTALIAQERDRFIAGAGVLYPGALVICAIALRLSDAFGLIAIAWLFALVWSTDIMAYFGGRLIGGPKLWPRVSEGKTWSGTLVGIFCGALCGFAVVLVGSDRTCILPVLLISLLLAAISQGGDLAESALKRRFDVKDSGALIPGHGGVMDRLDGFTAACICAALIGALRQYPFIAAGLFSW
ncbi:MAG: phosphatidate cytidylyltransferase [Methylobacteriaceae bacterium]|jgi:phosphatidate cytidylyltransferase|nr:phosphatidate cytidylyltransferase [Methylobacteriaceae bacterium]